MTCATRIRRESRAFRARLARRRQNLPGKPYRKAGRTTDSITIKMRRAIGILPARRCEEAD
jgi:hypothetical protein